MSRLPRAKKRRPTLRDDRKEDAALSFLCPPFVFVVRAHVAVLFLFLLSNKLTGGVSEICSRLIARAFHRCGTVRWGHMLSYAPAGVILSPTGNTTVVTMAPTVAQRGVRGRTMVARCRSSRSNRAPSVDRQVDLRSLSSKLFIGAARFHSSTNVRG